MQRASSRHSTESGFTLVELMVALLVMGIVLAAMAPAFYGMMKSSASTDQRSVADELAVAATEQLRALPYYEVGYGGATPSACTGSNAVTLGVTGPLDSLPTSKTVGTTTYTLTRCIYWVTSGAATTDPTTYSEAYKQSIVTVTWGSNNQYSYSETSALYPGGQGAYQSGGGQEFAPVQSGGGSGTAPPTPTGVTAADDSASPTNTIDVTWSPVSFTSTVQYEVEWVATGQVTPSVGPLVNGTSNGAGGLTYQVTGLTPGTAYGFAVVAVSDGAASAPSSSVSATTASQAQTVCSPTSINVVPNQATPNNEVVVDSTGAPVGWTSLSISVQASTTVCTNLSVLYGLNDSTGHPPLTGSSSVSLTPAGTGTWVGSATQSTWTVKTYGFEVAEAGTPISPVLQANVTPCQQKGNSGKC